MPEDQQQETTAEFKQLMLEAHELDIQYTGSDPVELYAIVMMERAERGRSLPVPCYGKSFDSTDRRCRVCQLRDQCADLDKSPRVVLVEAKLQAIPCEACDRGMLEVECDVNPETGEVRDYGCTTAGCQNSVGVQCGWEETRDKIHHKIVLGELLPEFGDPPQPKQSARDIILKKKPQAKAPIKKVVIVKKPRPPIDPSVKLGFKLRGKVYPSLTALVHAVTKTRNWSSKRFFKDEVLADLRPGDVIERKWNKRTLRVEVVER